MYHIYDLLFLDEMSKFKNHSKEYFIKTTNFETKWHLKLCTGNYVKMIKFIKIIEQLTGVRKHPNNIRNASSTSLFRNFNSRINCLKVFY